MSRYSLATALLFFFLTSYSLLEAAGVIGYSQNAVQYAVGTAIQSVYTFTYSTFLLYYAYLKREKRPSSEYMAGRLQGMREREREREREKERKRERKRERTELAIAR